MIDDEDEAETKPQPVKWSWLSFFSNLVAASAGWCRLCGAVLDSIWQQMDKHVEYKVDRVKFQERSALEIEALTKIPAEASHS